MHASSSFRLALPLLLLLTSQALAVYFTSPSAGTVWSDASGQTVSWRRTKGDAPVATLILEAADTQETITVADSVALSAGSLSFPSGLYLASPSSQYILLFVSSADNTDVYSQIGPFDIDAFDGQSSSSSSGSGGTPSNPKAASSSMTPAQSTTSRRTNTIVFSSTTSSSSTTTTTTSSTTTSTTTSSTTTTTPSSTTTSTTSTTTSSSTTPPPVVTVMETVTSGAPTGTLAASNAQATSNSAASGGLEAMRAKVTITAVALVAVLFITFA